MDFNLAAYPLYGASNDWEAVDFDPVYAMKLMFLGILQNTSSNIKSYSNKNLGIPSKLGGSTFSSFL